jgi:hypothetical protein
VRGARRAVLLTLTGFTLAACGTGSAQQPSPEDGRGELADLAIEVEVDVMSGRPNPTWTVTGETAQELYALLAALPDGGRTDVTEALQLGFRGFVLSGLELEQATGNDRYRVLGTDVVATTGTDTVGTRLVDEDQAVYELLRGLAAEQLDSNVMQAIPQNGREELP